MFYRLLTLLLISFGSQIDYKYVFVCYKTSAINAYICCNDILYNYYIIASHSE